MIIIIWILPITFCGHYEKCFTVADKETEEQVKAICLLSTWSWASSPQSWTWLSL